MFACSRVRAESRHRLRKRVLNLRIIACSGTRTTAVFARKTSLYLFSAKSTDRSLRLVLFAAFWSAKSGAKTDPPTKKAKRRGLTLAPGDYSRVCKQTVPSARAFSPHLFERLFCQAGVVRRETWREKSAFSLAAEKEQPTARVPGAGGCKGLILLRPLNAGRRLFPRKATCGWFWRYLLPPKGSYTPRHSPRFCLFDRRLTAVSARGR